MLETHLHYFPASDFLRSVYRLFHTSHSARIVLERVSAGQHNRGKHRGRAKLQLCLERRSYRNLSLRSVHRVLSRLIPYRHPRTNAASSFEQNGSPFGHRAWNRRLRISCHLRKLARYAVLLRQ